MRTVGAGRQEGPRAPGGGAAERLAKAAAVASGSGRSRRPCSRRSRLAARALSWAEGCRRGGSGRDALAVRLRWHRRAGFRAQRLGRVRLDLGRRHRDGAGGGRDAARRSD